MSLKMFSATRQNRSVDTAMQFKPEGLVKLLELVSTIAATGGMPYCASRSAMRSSGLLPAISSNPGGPEAKDDKSSSLMLSELTSSSPRISILLSANLLFWWRRGNKGVQREENPAGITSPISNNEWLYY